MSRLSYDDPGADDAEFLELEVIGSPPVSDAGPPTLSDCGVESLALLNGVNDTCATYRVVLLGDVPIPDDGFVLICSEQAMLASATPRCSVTRHERGPLPNGWLQNGPRDALAVMGPEGIQAAYGYEGINPDCLPGEYTELPADTGSRDGEAEDEVIVACDDGSFAVAPQTASVLGTPPTCPEPEPPDATPGDPAPNDGAGAPPSDGNGPPSSDQPPTEPTDGSDGAGSDDDKPAGSGASPPPTLDGTVTQTGETEVLGLPERDGGVAVSGSQGAGRQRAGAAGCSDARHGDGGTTDSKRTPPDTPAVGCTLYAQQPVRSSFPLTLGLFGSLALITLRRTCRTRARPSRRHKATHA